MKKYIKSAVMPIADDSLDAQLEVAMSTDSEDIMWKLLDSNCSWVVKLAIADNRHVTPEILEQLAEDTNSTVSKAAKWNLRNG